MTGVPAGPTTFDPDDDGLPDVLAANRLPEGGAGRVVALLSTALPGEDAWARRSAASVARSWARDGVRVFLADLSLDDPHLHETLGLENEEGVSDMFRFGTSVQRVARRVDDLPFFFASAGSPTWEPGEILANDRWSQLAEGFKEAGAALLLYVPASAPGAASILRRASDALILGSEEPGVLAEASDLSVMAWIAEADVGPPARWDVDEGAADGADREASGGDPAPASPPGGGWAPVDDWSESETQEWDIEAAAEAQEVAGPDQDPWGLDDIDLAPDGEDALSSSLSGDPDPDPVAGEGTVAGAAGLGASDMDVVGDAGSLEGIAPELEVSTDPSFEPGGADGSDDVVEVEEIAWGDADGDWSAPPLDSTSTDRPRHDPIPDPGAGSADEWADAREPAVVGADDGRSGPTSEERRAPTSRSSSSRPPRRSRRAVVWGGLAAALALAGYQLWDSGLLGGGAGGAGGEPPAGVEEGAVPGAAEATPGETAAGAGGGEPDAPPMSERGAPTSPVLGASLVLQSFPDGSEAQALADQLSEGLGDLLFIVVPSTVNDAVWYRTVAGPARDLSEIPGIRERIESASLPALAGSSGWFPRVTELAFLLDESPTVEGADAAAARYRAEGIPAYVLAIDFSEGPRGYRVYAGGYAFESESTPLAGILRQAGHTPELVPRIGSMPSGPAR